MSTLLRMCEKRRMILIAITYFFHRRPNNKLERKESEPTWGASQNGKAKRRKEVESSHEETSLNSMICGQIKPTDENRDFNTWTFCFLLCHFRFSNQFLVISYSSSKNLNKMWNILCRYLKKDEEKVTLLIIRYNRVALNNTYWKDDVIKKAWLEP